MMNLPLWLMLLDLLASSLVVLGLLRWSSRLGLARAPMLTGSLVFLLGMLPWGDQLARFSIWLHSLQSVAVHHLAPMLWMLAFTNASGRGDARETGSAPVLAIALLLAFALLSWIWMLPALHTPLMHDAGLYMAMRWAMALSGLTMLVAVWKTRAASQTREAAGYRLGAWINLSMSGPMLAWGVMMLAVPELYLQAHTTMDHGMMMAALPEFLSLPMALDQRLGGIIFLLFGLACLGLAYRPALLRVAEGVSPKRRRYSWPK
ncbi:cytochrome c oxidase assembly protein [Marinobacterium lutimaris]|uniref:Cytochrome c oxidase caa3 assembly factor (Caa3_CtaG) n=1 Tax=Marinobacterium lutimaris TaxID=568106 RepID=A0A1H5Y028_9GAMM|nr:cytochrome c oxidase assembly protein [Marinobacterium lutimaris]SEG17429.1 Cytochrome c oxidase caa3 assembly factor (Caa3_CtaG) [Marinobacterium lutimaris]